jgi:hypothetical protein
VDDASTVPPRRMGSRSVAVTTRHEPRLDEPAEGSDATMSTGHRAQQHRHTGGELDFQPQSRWLAPLLLLDDGLSYPVRE